MKESPVVSACIQWLHLNGCFVWRNNSGGYKSETGTWIRYGLTGSADIIGVMPATSRKPGVFLAVECKSDKGKQTDHQKRFEQQVASRGGIYVVAKGIDDLERELKHLL